MAISLVQTKAGVNANTTSIAATWGSNTTTGNLIVLVVYTGFGAFSVVSSISDSQSNTYTKLDSGTSGVGSCDWEFWYAKNITGGTTPTVTVHFSGSQDCNFLMREYSGIVTTAPVDQHTVTTATSSGGVQSSGNTSATTNANDLIIGWAVGSTATAISAVGSGFGNLVTATGTSNELALEDKIVSATGAQSASFTTTNATNNAIGVAAFKGSGGAASIPNKRFGTVSPMPNEINMAAIPRRSFY